MGSRLHEATRKTMPMLHRYVGTPALTAFIRTAGGYGGLTDSQSGFRCFRKDTIARLKLAANGMELTSEMLLKSSRHGLRLIEVPTGYRKRIGQSKLNTLQDGMRNLRVLVWLVPEAFFLAPGAALFLLGAVFTWLAFLPSRGIQIGSVRWQPIFFAAIALVLGLQALLVGLVFVWRRASVSGKGVTHLLRFVRSRAFPPSCSVVGAITILAGFALDAVLFARWIRGLSSFGDLPTASFAQSLILIGGTLVSFGLVVMWLHWDKSQNEGGSE
jgi:hypothetical protein